MPDMKGMVMKKAAVKIILLAGLAGTPAMAAPVAAPPPPVLVPRVPVPAPIIESPAQAVTARDYQRMQVELGRPVTLDIAITGAGAPLWNGSLRVTQRDSADYTQNMRQALEACPGEMDGTSRYGSMQSRLQLTVSTSSLSDAGQVFRVSAQWARPERQCGEPASQKSVAFEQSVTLAAGETRTLTGDAGFVVRLTRRR